MTFNYSDNYIRYFCDFCHKLKSNEELIVSINKRICKECFVIVEAEGRKKWNDRGDEDDTN